MSPAKTNNDIDADLPCGLDAVGNDVLWRISNDLVEDRDVKAAGRKGVSNRLDEAGLDETCIGNQQRLARLKPAGKNLRGDGRHPRQPAWRERCGIRKG